MKHDSHFKHCILYKLIYIIYSQHIIRQWMKEKKCA